MTILHNQCLPTELAKPANQAVIAATFNDCAGDPLTPGTQLATCNDIPAIPAAQTLSLAGQSLTLSGGGGTVTLPDSDDQTLSITGNVLAISGGNSVTLPDSDNQTLSISGNTLTISGGNAVTLPSAPASAIAIQDEGTVQGNAGTLNFVGPGVSASVSAGVATVTIPGPAAPTPVGIQDEGASVVATPSAINFVGAGVTVTDVGGVATVTVPAGGASHTTTVAACPATGPTVAPTAEGHYFYRSTIGELWQWVYGDAAAAVIGSYASGSAVTVGWPFTLSTAVPAATVVLIASVTLPRNGKIIASGGGITLCDTNTPTSIAAWLSLNGVQVSRDSTTVKPPGLVSAHSNDSGMAACVNVLAGDVLTYSTYITDTSGTASGRIDYVYTS